MATEEGAGGRGGREGRKGRDMGDEELDDAIDFEFKRVRRTTYRTDFSVQGQTVAGPRVIDCGKLADPGGDARDPSPGRWSFSEVSHSVSETGQTMVAHWRQGIFSGVRIQPLQTPHAMLAQGGEGRGAFTR